MGESFVSHCFQNFDPLIRLYLILYNRNIYIFNFLLSSYTIHLGT
jgi:hypothetical protein